MDKVQFELAKAIATFRTKRFYELSDKRIRKSEFSILMLINESTKEISAIELSRKYGCTKVYIGRVLDILEGNGWVERVTSPLDGRRQFLYTTQAGKDLINKCKDEYNSIMKSLYEYLGKEKAIQFTELLDESSKFLAQHYSLETSGKE